MIKSVSFYSCLLLIVINANDQKAESHRPNFIIIYTDDQRYDALGYNDNRVIITPRLDAMAKKSIRFQNANAVYALCSPSRAAFLTGRKILKSGRKNPGATT